MTLWNALKNMRLEAIRKEKQTRSATVGNSVRNVVRGG